MKTRNKYDHKTLNAILPYIPVTDLVKIVHDYMYSNDHFDNLTKSRLTFFVNSIAKDSKDMPIYLI